MSRHERRYLRLTRLTGKPHVYFAGGKWLVLKRTAPGEWWTSLVPQWHGKRAA